MKKILMSAAALLLSAVGAYAAQQKYYFLYEEGHEDQPETSWFILDREAKKYIPDSCGDDELTVKNYKKSGNTETFDCYDNSYFTHSVIMRKNDKGQTVVQISYEKGKTNGRKIVCGTEAEYDKYWEEYRAKNGGDGGSTSTSDNPVDKATKKVKSGLKSGLNKLKKKKIRQKNSGGRRYASRFFVPRRVCCATEYKRFRKFIGEKPIKYLQIAI